MAHTAAAAEMELGLLYYYIGCFINENNVGYNNIVPGSACVRARV